jgi:hypothetical protein
MILRYVMIELSKILLVIYFSFIFVTIADAQDRKLFLEVAPAVVSADARAGILLGKIKSRKSVTEVRVVRVDSNILREARDTINLNVFAGKDFIAAYEASSSDPTKITHGSE